MLPLPLLLDTDLTEAIGVYKYEPPVPEDMSAKSRFPSFISKTDEERVQNLIHKLPEYSKKLVYITEKLEGSSISIHCIRNQDIVDEKIDTPWLFGVSSRNLELKLEVPDENDVLVPSQNKFVNTARELNLYDRMLAWCVRHDQDLVLQGELIGTGVQDNIYRLHKNDIRFFTAQDGKNKKYEYGSFFNIMEELELETVPVLEVNFKLTDSYEILLALAEDWSKLNPKQQREGIVIRAMDGSFSFKVVSNKYLIKHGR
jgi:RNA ligase (TIGR02306 family)